MMMTTKDLYTLYPPREGDVELSGSGVMCTGVAVKGRSLGIPIPGC